jgi:hypothetical protein
MKIFAGAIFANIPPRWRIHGNLSAAIYVLFQHQDIFLTEKTTSCIQGLLLLSENRPELSQGSVIESEMIMIIPGVKVALVVHKGQPHQPHRLLFGSF